MADVRSEAGWAVVTLTGELDVSTSPRLRQELIDLINGGDRRLVIDLTDVALVDSTALGVLVGAHKRLREGRGDFRLVASSDTVLRVIRMAGLHHVFAIYDTVSDAVAARDET